MSYSFCKRKENSSVLEKLHRCSCSWVDSMEIINTHQSTGSAAPYMCGVAGACNI